MDVNEKRRSTQALALDPAGRRRYTEHLRTRVFGQAPVHEDLRDVAASLDARAARRRTRQQQQQQGQRPAGKERQTDRQTDPRDSQLDQDQQPQQQAQTEAPDSAQFGTVPGSNSSAEGTGLTPTYYSAMRHPALKSKPLAGHPSYLAVSETGASDPVCSKIYWHLFGNIAPRLSFWGITRCGHNSLLGTRRLQRFPWLLKRHLTVRPCHGQHQVVA